MFSLFLFENKKTFFTNLHRYRSVRPYNLYPIWGKFRRQVLVEAIPNFPKFVGQKDMWLPLPVSDKSRKRTRINATTSETQGISYR